MKVGGISIPKADGPSSLPPIRHHHRPRLLQQLLLPLQPPVALKTNPHPPVLRLIIPVIMAIQHKQVLPSHEIVHKPYLMRRVREHSHPARRTRRERHRHGAGVEFSGRLAARRIVEFVRLRKDQVVVEQDPSQLT